MTTLFPDRIEDDDIIILKRAIIGIQRAEKMDPGYLAPENRATTITIDGGQRFYIRLPTDKVMSWFRGPQPSTGRPALLNIERLLKRLDGEWPIPPSEYPALWHDAAVAIRDLSAQLKELKEIGQRVDDERLSLERMTEAMRGSMRQIRDCSEAQMQGGNFARSVADVWVGSVLTPQGAG